MHELSIAENILKIVESNISGYNFEKVKTINLKVGKLTAVVSTALVFAFEVLSSGTVFENAKINIREMPIKIICKVCKVEKEIENYHFVCPTCESENIEIISGRELLVEDVEIE